MTAMTAAGGTNESEMTTYNDFDNEKNIINAFRREQLQAAHPPGDKTYEAERKGRTRLNRNYVAVPSGPRRLALRPRSNGTGTTMLRRFEVTDGRPDVQPSLTCFFRRPE